MCFIFASTTPEALIERMNLSLFSFYVYPSPLPPAHSLCMYRQVYKVETAGDCYIVAGNIYVNNFFWRLLVKLTCLFVVSGFQCHRYHKNVALVPSGSFLKKDKDGFNCIDQDKNPTRGAEKVMAFAKVRVTS